MLVTKDDLKPEKKGEEIKGFSGKAVFTGKGLFGKMGCSFTVGKVYEFKDGYTTDDSGNKRPFGRKPVIDFDKSSFICGDFEKYVEPKYYSGKVVCVKHPRKVGFTVGKVYEVVEGKIIDDDCDRRPCTPDHIKNLDDYCPGCFIPYVEAAAGKEPKYYSGKVVCVKKSNGFTPGKIYEFKDGKVIDDDGDVRPIPSLFGLPEMRIESLDDAFCEGRFIPYVE